MRTDQSMKAIRQVLLRVKWRLFLNPTETNYKLGEDGKRRRNSEDAMGE
jgi:hypothetical protein